MSSLPIERLYAGIAQPAREAGARRVLLFGSRAWDEAAQERHRPHHRGCADLCAPKHRLHNDLWNLLELDVINLDDDSAPRPAHGLRGTLAHQACNRVRSRRRAAPMARPVP